jgi:hypothetical protein
LLGRLHGINRKHRLRAKHYAAIQDWPESATFDVLDAADLAKRDHLTTTDALFVVSDKLKCVLAAAAPKAQFFAADAGGTRVWVVPPPTDDDVMYETQESPTYATGGYQITRATELRVAERPRSPWSRVRNASIVALSDALVASGASAGIAWSPVESFADYSPHTPHPYVIVRSCGGDIETLEKLSSWPAVPGRVRHPLHDWVRDEEFEEEDPDEAWSALVENRKDVAEASLVRFFTGLPLPKLRAVLDPGVAKSKLKKRWNEATKAGGLSCKGLFVVSPAIKDLLGPSCTYMPIELHDPKLEETHEGFSVVEPPAASFIDWSRSDVAFSWNGMIEGYFGLHPTAESYTSTQPIVRAEGTGLILVHRDIAAKLDATFTSTRSSRCQSA